LLFHEIEANLTIESNRIKKSKLEKGASYYPPFKTIVGTDSCLIHVITNPKLIA